MSSHNSFDPLERLIERSVRDLPLRRAPQQLQARVLAELQRRAALPWWRKQFSYWPASARIAFLALCLGLANTTIVVLRWLSAQPNGIELGSVFKRSVAVVETASSVVQGADAFFTLLLRHIPAPLLYGGLVGVALLYVALFGIGAAAYRTLYARR